VVEVVVLLTVFQRPETLLWIFTGTVSADAVNPSLTVTLPRATREYLSRREMLRAWSAVTVKVVELVAVPLGVVTVIGPVVAVGTFVTICVAVFDVIVALTPLNFTEVATVRFVPLIVTVVPTGTCGWGERGDRGRCPCPPGRRFGNCACLPAGKFTTDTLLQVTFGVLRLTNHAGVSLTKDISVELAPGLGMSGWSG
jgi:hypothetical protein